jgi:phosphomethylpyrimidine synthase
VNANIGTSSDISDPEVEIEKLHQAINAGADAVMDLSTGGDIAAIRKRIIENCSVPIGTVPIYQAAIHAIRKHGAIVRMTTDELFDVIEEQASDGVDFVTVHCGVTRQALNVLGNNPRVGRYCKWGGSFMRLDEIQQCENPLYEHFGRLLDIARRYDVTLSLGDGLRPGCIADGTDGAQITELITLGELVLDARKAGVQVMVEGPGHLPLDQIEANIKLEKQLWHKRSFLCAGGRW